MKRLPQIINYKNDETIDYCEDIIHENGLTVGCCEICGVRPNQEDAVVTDASDASARFAALSAQDQSEVMKETFQNLQENCGQVGQGSCACVANGTIQNNHVMISTSYVGDSVAYLIVLDKTGKFKHSEACNTELHDGNNQKEVDNIHQGNGRKKGIVIGKRLGAVLAVTRALGDNELDNEGISHEPEIIKTKPYQLAEGDIAYMVVGCDGIMEHLKGENVASRSAKEIENIFSTTLTNNLANNIKTNASDLAELIVANAKTKGSKDNISAMVVQLAEGKAVTMGVFDGHGGVKVANAASESFPTVFAAAVNKKKGLKVVQDPITEPVQSEKIVKLNQAVETYFNALLNDVKDVTLSITNYVPDKKRDGALLSEKMTIVHELYQILNQPRSKSVTETDVLAEFSDCLTRQRENNKTNADILGNRRYVTRGAWHATQVFFKSIIAIFPLLIDLASHGKTGLYQKLFPVKGKAFVKEVNELVHDVKKPKK